MTKYVLFLGLLIVAGCMTVKEGDYRPESSVQNAAFLRADRDVSPNQVRKDFESLKDTELAWAGIIREVEFREEEETIQVAFKVEHRYFDWWNYGGSIPYQLSERGEGIYLVGWTVPKPTRIDYLETQVKPGYMLIAYGTPIQVLNDAIQLAATAVHPIPAKKFMIDGNASEATNPLESMRKERTRRRSSIWADLSSWFKKTFDK